MFCFETEPHDNSEMTYLHVYILNYWLQTEIASENNGLDIKLIIVSHATFG